MERINDLLTYTGPKEIHSVFTISLGELIETGVFSWDSELLNWESAAYDREQYERVCAYFIERFYYREISLVPFKQWARMVHYSLVYELMPKYRELYSALENGYNPIADGDEYYKERKVNSRYPETLLTNSADYLESGIDTEWERVKIGPINDALDKIKAQGSIDQMLCDELETFFYGLYTANANGF